MDNVFSLWSHSRLCCFNGMWAVAKSKRRVCSCEKVNMSCALITLNMGNKETKQRKIKERQKEEKENKRKRKG